MRFFTAGKGPVLKVCRGVATHPGAQSKERDWELTGDGKALYWSPTSKKDVFRGEVEVRKGD